MNSRSNSSRSSSRSDRQRAAVRVADGIGQERTQREQMRNQTAEARLVDEAQRAFASRSFRRRPPTCRRRARAARRRRRRRRPAASLRPAPDRASARERDGGRRPIADRRRRRKFHEAIFGQARAGRRRTRDRSFRPDRTASPESRSQRPASREPSVRSKRSRHRGRRRSARARTWTIASPAGNSVVNDVAPANRRFDARDRLR